MDMVSNAETELKKKRVGTRTIFFGNILINSDD